MYPITATVYHEKYAGFFRADPFLHISTFGGSEIGCFAALEVLRISRRKQFLDRVNRMEDFFTRQFTALSKKYPSAVLRPRGLGLMMGLEFKNEGTALLVMKMLFDKGVYLVYSGNDSKVLQFMPPLIITVAQGGEIVRCLESVMKALEER
ncbi:MAG: aminotransferase class III-fold pyridoxal phosphate-dependent enzyme [Chrysiogenales bacterium]|nr:MAG: aminotransferase class III-fold pyridoxal phosphate-dependent enzyme [Chrysiogenales bacterium]